MDVRGLLKGDFGKHTRLVKSLAKEVERLTTQNKMMHEALSKRRQPVLVTCESTGDVWVYAGVGIELAALDLPIGIVDPETIERYADLKIGKRHKGIMYWARNRHGPFNGHGCQTVEELLARTYDKRFCDALDWVRQKRAEWDKMMEASK